MGRVSPIAICGLTAVAFVLRLLNLDQSLFQDEYWTYGVVTRNGLTGVVSDVYNNNEITPPLFSLLAWLAAQVGDTTTWIRVPSLILGTATVPVTYLLGRRTFGDRTGLFAAALMALSPFAIFYSTEARAYATMVFLVTLSTLALLRALDGEGRGWWIAYTASACAALYTHYTAVFVLAVQAGWAFWFYRDRLRTLVIAHVAIVIGYLPWFPGFLEQRGKSNSIETIGAIGLNTVGADLDPHHLTVGGSFESVALLLPGHPFLGLESMPGRVALALLVIAGSLAAVAAVVHLARSGPPRRLLVNERVVLIVGLGLATPVGLLLYAAIGEDLYTPRNMSASIPALAIAVAAFLGSVPPRLAPVTAGLVIAAFAIGAVKTFDRDYQRPAFRDVAHFLEGATAPGDRVVDQSRSQLLGGPGEEVVEPLSIYLDGDPEVLRANENDAAAWQQVKRGGNLYFVRLEAGLYRGLPPLGGPDHRVVLRDRRVYRGLVPLLVGRYSGQIGGRLERKGGRETITWSLGRDIVVSGGATRGHVEDISTLGTGLQVSGWATDASGRRGAEWLLCFVGRRLLAAAWPRVPRADVAKKFGARALISGFDLTVPTIPPAGGAGSSALHVFAVVGHRASEIEPTTARETG